MRESISLQIAYYENKIKLIEGINNESLFSSDMVCIKASGEKKTLGKIY